MAHYFPSSIATKPLLLYYPVYTDLSEFHFGQRLSSCFGWKRSLGPFLSRHFDVQLVRTVPIEEPQVIIGLHPHAILPLGAVLSVVHDDSSFPALFPTLANRLVLCWRLARASLCRASASC